MTFEQKLKELLKDDLEQMFGLNTEHRRSITVANDVSSRALTKQNSLLAVVKTGQGLRTAIYGYDVVNLSLYIDFYFDRNFLQIFLNEMNDYVKTSSALVKTVTIDDISINYQINYNNPTPSRTAIDQEVEGKTIQFAQVVLMGEIMYSGQVNFNAPTISFDHFVDEENANRFEVKNIIRYSRLKQPAVEPSQYLGANKTKKDTIGYESVHTISLLAVDGDYFVDYIKSNFNQTNDMYLTVNNVFYQIQNVTVTETWENGTKTLECIFSE